MYPGQLQSALAVGVLCAFTAGTPAFAGSRDVDPAIVKQIQAHLVRVGCYDGEVTGRWDEATLYAYGRYDHAKRWTAPGDLGVELLGFLEKEAGPVCGQVPIDIKRAWIIELLRPGPPDEDRQRKLRELQQRINKQIPIPSRSDRLWYCVDPLGQPEMPNTGFCATNAPVP